MFSLLIVETPDDFTVIINLEHPHPAILLAMSSFAFVIPEHIYNDGQVSNIIQHRRCDRFWSIQPKYVPVRALS